MHSIQKGSYFLYFLEIHDKLVGKIHLMTTLYHILAVLEIFFYRIKKDGSTFHESLGNAG